MGKRLSRWMPWSDFTRIKREICDQSDGMLIFVGLLVLGTVIASAALPRLSLLISIIGGLLIVVTITVATGQYRELVDGLAEIGGLPSGIVLTRLLWQVVLTDVQCLWHGNAHSKQLSAIQQTTALYSSECNAGDDQEGNDP